jgi:hypothetical protein
MMISSELPARGYRVDGKAAETLRLGQKALVSMDRTLRARG